MELAKTAQTIVHQKSLPNCRPLKNLSQKESNFQTSLPNDWPQKNRPNNRGKKNFSRMVAHQKICQIIDLTKMSQRIDLTKTSPKGSILKNLPDNRPHKNLSQMTDLTKTSPNAGLEKKGNPKKPWGHFGFFVLFRSKKAAVRTTENQLKRGQTKGQEVCLFLEELRDFTLFKYHPAARTLERLQKT